MRWRAIDLFAGWGGFTLGAEQAGARVVWAANHWPLAVRAHAENHPHVEHACQDLRQANWTKVPSYELLLASPACQGHSNGSQPKRLPKHDDDRATAWAVVDCADATEPRALIVENVLNMRRWRLYDVWKLGLEKLGFTLTEVVTVATWHGVPQRRERLFVVGLRGRRFDYQPVVPLVEPAFGPFLEPAANDWRPLTEMQPGARARVIAARGRRGRRFLSQHVTDHPGVPLYEPIRTITTKDQWILVDGDDYRPLTVREHARAMGFPDDFGWPSDVSRPNAIRGLGGAVPPGMARDLTAAVLAAA
ncbi:MAG: DNA cytosine methyltransferase [Rhodocyclaceae bacterium]|nr:MAG: DNA cytosine methyltransferase [Rhodocyclaceae bacterium]